MSSSTSSTARVLMTPSPSVLKSCSKATSLVQAKWGFVTFVRKDVPWLPFTVTQPSALSVSDRPRMRAIFSCITGPSNTSMTSSISRLRTIFVVDTSMPSVMAIAFTTVKYCCTKARNFLFPIPSASMCLAMRSACSGLRERPSRDCRCSLKACSETRSSPGFSRSAKSISLVNPLFCASWRSAAETPPERESTMAWQAFLTDSMTPLLFF
mmetsp:Transcript_34730/g.94043  ORF Transcript_34730/g.94043 Transcript_34730/m.94043 type:complete len:211 (-) Transcript_34730:3991-4623(-)